MKLALGPVTLDLDRGRLDGPDGASHLTELECRLLARLAAANGAIVPRGELLEQVWGYRPTMATRTVDVAVARLRARLEQDPGDPRHILTVRGEGYRLVREAPAEQPPALAPPPPLGRVHGRDADVQALLAALPVRAVQLAGLPGMGRTTLAAAVAAAWPGPVAWVSQGREEDVVASLAAAFGVAAEPLHVLRMAQDFDGLLVVDGAGSLPFPARPRLLVAMDRPLPGAEVHSVGPLGGADGLALLRDALPRAERAEEADALRGLAEAAAGVPHTLVQLARRLRFEDAPALLERVRTEGVDPPASWAEAREVLGAEARTAVDTLATLGHDFPYEAATAVAAPDTVEELLAAGWLGTRWSARGELRLALAGPHAPAPADPRLGGWLASLPPGALLREAPSALAWVSRAAAAPPSLLAALHEVCRVRGGWEAYAAALGRVPDEALTRDLAYARAEARWQVGDPEGSLADFSRALGTDDDGERLALRASYRSRAGDLAGARADLAQVPSEAGPGSVEGLLMAALLDSEAGDADSAEPRLRAALAAAERIGRPRQVARARFYLGTALLHRAEPAAGPQLRRAVDELRALGAEASAALGETVLAWALVQRGELGAALALLDVAIANLTLGGLAAAAASARRARAAFRLLAGEDAADELHALLTAPPPGEAAAIRAMLAYVEVRRPDAYEAGRQARAAREALAGEQGEPAAIVAAWLHAAGLGATPADRWTAVSPEVRLAGRLSR